jgi:hypothetical protein
MALRLSTGLRQDLLGTKDFKTTFTNCYLAVYAGTQPTSPDDAVVGALLAVIYSDGATATAGLGFDAPVAGVISKAAAETWSGVALASGTAGYFRVFEFNTDAATSLAAAITSDPTSSRLDGSIAVSGGDLNISNTTITSGAVQTITDFDITLPAS